MSEFDNPDYWGPTIYEFEPPRNDDAWSTPKKYRVVKCDRAEGGCVIFGWFRNKWEQCASAEVRALVIHLIQTRPAQAEKASQP